MCICRWRLKYGHLYELHPNKYKPCIHKGILYMWWTTHACINKHTQEYVLTVFPVFTHSLSGCELAAQFLKLSEVFSLINYHLLKSTCENIVKPCFIWLKRKCSISLYCFHGGNCVPHQVHFESQTPIKIPDRAQDSQRALCNSSILQLRSQHAFRG